ncbi:hypothetical protein SCLCIDRAFT_1225224 [Scleroderma citrinum Foug A]|uniref:Uncharacterized protein n=1 Tax=Scleroderma citrinum Foug A TaxID=1036808 RepID=A0A0C2ZC98_9AGAM|nr:hypothetical protein SCLCIDRAFT_1225224 [Scleroderma citrinum Foug A]
MPFSSTCYLATPACSPPLCLCANFHANSRLCAVSVAACMRARVCRVCDISECVHNLVLLPGKSGVFKPCSGFLTVSDVFASVLELIALPCVCPMHPNGSWAFLARPCAILHLQLVSQALLTHLQVCPSPLHCYASVPGPRSSPSGSSRCELVLLWRFQIF